MICAELRQAGVWRLTRKCCIRSLGLSARCLQPHFSSFKRSMEDKERAMNDETCSFCLSRTTHFAGLMYLESGVLEFALMLHSKLNERVGPTQVEFLADFSSVILDRAGADS